MLFLTAAKRSYRSFLTAGLLFLGYVALGQSALLDSLNAGLRKETVDSVRLRLYLALGEECELKDNLVYAEPALALVNDMLKKETRPEQVKSLLTKKARIFSLMIYYYFEIKDSTRALACQRGRLDVFKELKDSTAIIRTALNICYLYRQFNNIPMARDYLRKARALAADMHFKKGEIMVLGSTANFFGEAGEYKVALASCEQALELARALNDSSEIITFLFRIGSISGTMGDVHRAETYMTPAKSFYKRKKDSVEIAHTYNVVGLMYFENGRNDSALSNFITALSYVKNRYDRVSLTWVRGILNNLAELSLKTGDWKSGMDYARQSLTSAELTKDSLQLVWGLKVMAIACLKTGNLALADSYIQRSLSIARATKNDHGIMVCEELAYKVDSAMGDSRGALDHFRQYIQLRDKIKSAELFKEAASEKTEADYEKQKLAEKAEQEKRDLAAREEMERQQIIRNAFIAGFVLVLLLVAVVLRSYRQKQRSNKELAIKNKVIEEKNKDIMDSISYARRIQAAKLPDLKEVSAALPQSFVLYKPKDVVSGDFYFLHRKKGDVYLAAGDCTGHGVPGAFMSLIAHERLDDALVHQNNAADILAHLNKGVRASLKQTDADDSTRDGLDIALCVIAPQQRTIEYAGANRPLWILRHDADWIEEIKATKKAIGGLTPDDQAFEAHRVALKEGDQLYIFSDGYGDTFSGKTGKKLTTKKFREILVQYRHLPMDEQLHQLDTYIEVWKSGIEQVDDILVIGVRL